MAIKRNKWQSAFEKELTKADKRQISKVKRYYKSEYNKGIESFLAEGQTNFQLLFNTSDLLKIYRDLYSDIGLQFAKWYARNFDKYIEKGINPNQYVDQWQNPFASYGSAVGAQRVTLVSGTAKKTLIKVTQQLLTDIDFQKLGIIEKGRILKSQFNRYSTYQAERLVRTEATNAANFATTESAKTIFPAEQLMKEWIASFDDRTRTTHAEVDGNEVSANDTFMVGGAQMMFPGDPSAPASEVINCRCSVAYFPKANAQATGEITDLNFGLGGGTTTGFGLGDVVSAIGSTIASGAKKSMRPDNWNKIVPENAKVNDKYLSLLKEKPNLQSSNKGSYMSGNTIVIDTVRYNSETIEKVLAHEFGHLIHTQRKWVQLAGRHYKSIEEVVSAIGSTIASGVQNAAQQTTKVFKTIKELKEGLIERFSRVGIDVTKIRASRKLSINQYNLIYDELDKLFNKYNFSSIENKNKIQLLFSSGSRTYGFVERFTVSGNLTRINLGDKILDSASRTRIIEKFRSKRWFSAIDADKMLFATPVHEMTHVLLHTSMKGKREVLDKIREVRQKYYAEIRSLRDANNVKKYNEIYIGQYALHSLDEFIAEAFTEYTLSSNPSKYSRLVGEIIDQYLKN